MGPWKGGSCHVILCPSLSLTLPFRQLSERYGPMFTVHLGGQKTVVLSGYEAVRDALVGTGQELADRPPIPIFQLIQQGRGRYRGLLGSPWEGQGVSTWAFPSWAKASPEQEKVGCEGAQLLPTDSQR